METQFTVELEGDPKGKMDTAAIRLPFATREVNGRRCGEVVRPASSSNLRMIAAFPEPGAPVMMNRLTGSHDRSKVDRDFVWNF